MTGSDVVVVGGGLVGLACALALADRDVGVVLVDEPRVGAASGAAAGILAPSIGAADAAVRRFGVAARDRFPRCVADLRERTGFEVPLDREGILELAIDEEDADRLRGDAPPAAEWLDRPALRRLEPALAHAVGALRLPGDGAVDNVVLLDAMARLAETSRRIRRVAGAAARIDAGDRRAVAQLADGSTVEGSWLVVAAGAWAGTIAGLPRALPVEPVRGQILALDGAPVRHVVHAGGGYLVPRGAGRTLVGSTSERAGFDASTTAAGIAGLAALAVRLCPALGGATPLAEWGGLRPMTPDGLPIIGREPRAPTLLYAAGHSRNGVLLAPLTGECVAALVRGERPPLDLSPFAADRFDR